MNFKVLIEKDEDGYYVATVPSLPGCISQGKTEAQARKNIKEAIELHMSALVEEGVPLIEKANVKQTTVAVSL
ncbi:MAG: type II toxin-antitoxin system HicB family antitoxin [Candidatus Thermoplasmatota archaeon]|nr:type II toxin-antitoxin system HicB family antitoxin [Euryarchaeota archaeon]MBU4071980.1 type II toxin-antitoxin system HicB family antitoxin [Candidatus Thermoplasmatota archaeon]MBU4145248.1 type II toxin-antitoxin system HicB family antitoxin [Candidatus Thermoplasmatota archaeon]MBU4591215.1 type II toxin-antitoxin system HicB family antitoxin [Candidatus Thermoplasmatota archaeon]